MKFMDKKFANIKSSKGQKNRNTYLEFLENVLKANADSDSDPQVIYPILQANLDKLDDRFASALRDWTAKVLLGIEPKKAQDIAAEIGNVSNLIRDFPINSASNLEIAIVGYESIATVFTREDVPDQWAMLQNQMGNAYCDRSYNKDENIKQAIQYYQAALQVYTRKAFPKEWAMTQNNLGTAYYERSNLVEDLDLAIQCFKSALEVRTFEVVPQDWALSQNNLGAAYLKRIRSDKVKNIEEEKLIFKAAICCYKNALKVYTYEAFPRMWASIQNSLGNAYRNRICGEQSENIEQAIQHYEAALQFYNKDEFPIEWGDVKNSLGCAYISGTGSENIDRAILCYQDILQVGTRDAFPEYWAATQNNLGMAYSNKIVYGERAENAENIEKAIKYYQASLQVRTRETFPEDWAKTQNNLGLAYLKQKQICDNRVKSLEQATQSFEAALQVFSREAFPKNWADIQNHLGLVYKERGQTAKVIACFLSALKIDNDVSSPTACLRTGKNLGHTAFADSKWLQAIEGYGAAIKAVEQLRTWATSESRRKEILEDATIIYIQMVQACINTDQLDKAIETVERSRSKRLVDLMASNDLYSGGEIPPEVQELLHQYEALQKQIYSEHFGNNSDSNSGFMETGSRTQNRAAFQPYNEAIHILETQKDHVFQKIRRLDPVLAGEIKVSDLDFARMQKLIDRPTTAILSFYTTTDNTYIFILRQNQSTPDLHTCEGQGIETLQNWIVQNWLQPYCNDKDAWQSQLGNFLAELAQRLQINNLISCYLQGIEELILVPHLLLHQIPLAALPIEDTEHSYLGEKFLIRYVPSCQVLEFCQERENRHPIGDSLNYGIVANATEDLACASFEAEQIAHLFNIPESQHLQGRSQATKSNYRQLASQVQVLHSCHHAESRLDKPLESILKLADGTLTLGELLTPGWRLPNLLDVFLSCCETNLGFPESLADEILTLSTGFLCAGARSVISTLWSVDDLATALFSIFYYQHRQEGKSRPEALQQAQKKLRSLTQEDIKSLSQKVQTKRQEARKQRNQHPPASADYLKWDGEYRKYAGVAIQIDKVRTAPNYEPFSYPRYWAAFTCSGLR